MRQTRLPVPPWTVLKKVRITVFRLTARSTCAHTSESNASGARPLHQAVSPSATLGTEWSWR